MDSIKHAILEDFLDDVNKEDVVQRDIHPGKDDSYSFLLTGRIDFPERADKVKTELDNLMDSTPAISRYDVMVYPLQQQADIMNQFDLKHEYIIVRFSL